MVLLPLLLDGDGTAAGKAQMILSYNFTAALCILSLATIWTSCGSISREISDRQLQMVLCKPVTAGQIWLGKWLGILLVTAFLLGLCTLITFFAVHLVLPADTGPQSPSASVLTCRMALAPALPPLDNEVALRIKSLRAEGILTKTVSDLQVWDEIRRQVVSERQVAAGGTSREWRFHFSKAPPPGRLTLTYSFEPIARDLAPVLGTWSIHSTNGTSLWSGQAISTLDGTSRIEIPSAVEIPKGEILLRYSNPAGNRTLVFSEEIRFLYPASSFGLNMLRTTLILFGTLALLAALGLSIGALFSFPVSIFTSATIMLIALIVHFFVQYENIFQFTHEGDLRATTLVDRYGAAAIHVLHAVVAPTMRYQPLYQLSNGLLVSNYDTFMAIAVQCLLYPAVMGIITAYLLSRRQVALPDLS
jgi:hypothetical protein